MADSRTDELVQHLRGLKNPTAHQRLLIALADRPNPSAADTKKFLALVRAERATERAAAARANVAQMLHSEQRREREIERKARAHRLIQLGGLVELAGLADRDRGEILGALLSAIRTAEKRPEVWGEWKRAGDARLAAPGGKSASAEQPQQQQG